MKRTPKFGSRYGFKRFVEGGSTMGGPTSYADSGSAGGKVKSSASRRADGIAVKGKTRGKFV